MLDTPGEQNPGEASMFEGVTTMPMGHVICHWVVKNNGHGPDRSDGGFHDLYVSLRCSIWDGWQFIVIWSVLLFVDSLSFEIFHHISPQKVSYEVRYVLSVSLSLSPSIDRSIDLSIVYLSIILYIMYYTI